MIKLEHLEKRFDDVVLFDDLTAEFQEHKVTCILGGSGKGKTTLINLLAGLDTPTGGTIFLPENAAASYVFQEPRLLPWLDPYQNLDLVLKRLYSKAERDTIILHYLKLVGLENEAHKPLAELSGGMIQRVSLARAFAYPSDLLFLDEPFKGLDPKLKEELLNAFETIYEHDERTVFFVTHDIEEAIRLADEIYVLAGKPACFTGHFRKENFDSALSEKIINLL